MIPGHNRKITAVTVDPRGYVSHLWNDSADWSPCAVSDAVLDMDLGEHSYSVDMPDDPTQIVEADDAGGRYLTTSRHAGGHNYLLEMPRRALG